MSQSYNLLTNALSTWAWLKKASNPRAILEKKAELQDIESASHRELAEASGRIPSFPRPAPKAQLLLRRARELTLAIGSPKIPALLVEEFPKRAWKSEARQQALADLEQYRREAGEAEAQRLCTLLERLVMTWSDGGYVPFDPESENSYSGGAIEALRKMRADLNAGRERLEVEISRRRGELADRMVALGRTRERDSGISSCPMPLRTGS